MSIEAGVSHAAHSLSHLSLPQVAGYGILAGVGVYAVAAGISAIGKKVRQAVHDINPFA